MSGTWKAAWRVETAAGHKVAAGPTYAIVTPVKDEAHYIEHLLRAVTGQHVLPVHWVIVDDGSTDGTREIVKRWAERFDWIELISLPDRGYRAPGGDDVFHLGVQRLSLERLDYLARVDGDVCFEADYFEKLIDLFENNPRLGIASGEMVYVDRPEPEVVAGPRFQTHGPCKFYRVSCLQQIGGLAEEIGWDILDNLQAIRLGWEARRLSQVRFVHFRRVGQRRGKLGLYHNLGRAAYLCGYHPLFFWAKWVRYLPADPPVLGSLTMARAYLRPFLRREARLVDREMRRFVRREQLKRLFGMKSIWR